LGTVQFVNTKFWPHNTSLWVKDFKGNDPSFVYYSLKNLPLADFNAGAGVPTLNRNHLDQLLVTYFPIEYQKQVSLILKQFDYLIAKNNRRIQILEEIAQRLYEEWFIHFKFPGHEKVKMIDSELGRIPEEWGIKSVGEITKLHIGGGWGKENKDQSHTEKVKVIRGTDLDDASSCQLENLPKRYEKQSKLTSRKLDEFDFVIEVSGGSKDQPVGRSMLILNEHLLNSVAPLICASFCKKLKIDKDIFHPYIFALHLNRIYESREITKYQTQSTGISNFKWKFFLEKHLVLIPPTFIQEKFVNIMSEIFQQKLILGKKNVMLSQMRDLLLPRLTLGEIEV